MSLTQGLGKRGRFTKVSVSLRCYRALWLHKKGSSKLGAALQSLKGLKGFFYLGVLTHPGRGLTRYERR